MIGRDKVQVDIPVESAVASGLAALIVHGGLGEWTLMDLATCNGTYLSGRRVGRAALQDNDEIMVGDCSIRVLLS